MIVDVNGVGYQVFVPATVLSSLPEVGGKATLVTHLIVREDEMTLYGFSNQTELQAFRILLGVSGVGPKVALALLSTLDVERTVPRPVHVGYPRDYQSAGSGAETGAAHVPGIGRQDERVRV